MLAWYILSGRCVVRLRRAPLSWPMFADILRVGGVGVFNTLQTSATVALTTAMVGATGGPEAVAGYGTGARLEYLLIPLVFGLGAPMVALVGTNIGAGQRQRALRIALTGGALAFVVTEIIGVAAAVWPSAWLGLFGNDPAMLATGIAYLRHVGPTYGFFGLGLSLFFASQGAGRLAWPLLGGTVRPLIAAGGGWIVLSTTGSLAMDVRVTSRQLRDGRLRHDAGHGDRVGRVVPRPQRAGAAASTLDLSCYALSPVVKTALLATPRKRATVTSAGRTRSRPRPKFSTPRHCPRTTIGTLMMERTPTLAMPSLSSKAAAISSAPSPTKTRCSSSTWRPQLVSRLLVRAPSG